MSEKSEGKFSKKKTRIGRLSRYPEYSHWLREVPGESRKFECTICGCTLHGCLSNIIRHSKSGSHKKSEEKNFMRTVSLSLPKNGGVVTPVIKHVKIDNKSSPLTLSEPPPLAALSTSPPKPKPLLKGPPPLVSLSYRSQTTLSTLALSSVINSKSSTSQPTSFDITADGKKRVKTKVENVTASISEVKSSTLPRPSFIIKSEPKDPLSMEGLTSTKLKTTSSPQTSFVIQDPHLLEAAKLKTSAISLPAVTNMPTAIVISSKATDELGIDTEKKIKTEIQLAELRISSFLVKRNIPLSAVEEMITLFQEIGENPEVLQAIKMGRTKCKAIVQNILSPLEAFTSEIDERHIALMNSKNLYPNKVNKPKGTKPRIKKDKQSTVPTLTQVDSPKLEIDESHPFLMSSDHLYQKSEPQKKLNKPNVSEFSSSESSNLCIDRSHLVPMNSNSAYQKESPKKVIKTKIKKEIEPKVQKIVKPKAKVVVLPKFNILQGMQSFNMPAL